MKRCKKREKKIFYRPLGKHYERVKGKLVEISIMNGVWTKVWIYRENLRPWVWIYSKFLGVCFGDLRLFTSDRIRRVDIHYPLSDLCFFSLG